MTNLMVWIPVLVLCVAVFAGCDAVEEYVSVPGGKQETARQKAELARQKEAAEERERTDAERVALACHLEASICSLKKEAEACSNRMSVAMVDRKTLSARIQDLSTGGDGKRTPSRQDALSAMLSDDRINDVASRYMDRDFRMVRLEFVDAMRAALDFARRRDEALSKNRKAYDDTLADIRERSGKTHASAEKSVANIRQSIAALERRETELQRTLAMSSAVRDVRRQKESELREITTKLRRLQMEYDAVRADQGADTRSDMNSRRLGAEADSAQRRLQRADEHVRRSFVGGAKPGELVSDYEAKTIGTLEKTLVTAVRESEASLKRLQGCIDYLHSTSSRLEDMSSQALRKIRGDVDSRIAEVTSARK